MGIEHEVSVIDDEGIGMPVALSEVEGAVRAVLDHEGVGRPVCVSISIVGADRIRELNAGWRGIDAATDVLSFECDSPFDEDIPDGEPVELGDVVLCPAVIAEQAPRYSGDAADEFRLMLVHGLFHLMGYDHMEEADALEMEAAELDALRELALARGVDPATVELGPMTRHIDD